MAADVRRLGGEIRETTVVDQDQFQWKLLTWFFPNIERPALVKIRLTNSRVTDAELNRITQYPLISHLYLGCTQGQCSTEITDDGLTGLRSQIHLKELGLEESAITDQGLRHFKEARSLGKLYTAGTNVTYLGLRELAGTPQRCDYVRQRAYAELQRLSGVEFRSGVLSLHPSDAIDVAGLQEHLPHVGDLAGVEIFGGNLPTEVVDVLRDTKFHSVSCSCFSEPCEELLTELQAINPITRLRLIRCPISLATQRCLSSLPELVDLEIQVESVTDEELSSLQSVFPKCRILRLPTLRPLMIAKPVSR